MKIRGFTCDPKAFEIVVWALGQYRDKSKHEGNIGSVTSILVQSFLDSLLQAIEDSAE